MDSTDPKPTWINRLSGAFAPPLKVSGLEGLIMRGFFALVIPQVMPAGLDRTSMPRPNGVAQWLDLTWMAQPGMEGLISSLLVVLLLLYVAGAGLAVVTPAILAITVAVRTLENSAASIHHGYQIISMILLAQSAVYIWQAWLGRSLAGRFSEVRGIQRPTEAWILWASQMAMVALYLVSVASKLENSEGQWLFKSHGFATEVVKTYRQSYYSRLEAEWGVPGVDPYPPMAAWIAAHPFFARIMFGAGFAAELISFLVLLRWRVAGFFVGLALIGMHASIDVVMGLEFPQNVDCLWIFFVGVPFLIAWPLQHIFGVFRYDDGQEKLSPLQRMRERFGRRKPVLAPIPEVRPVPPKPDGSDTKSTLASEIGDN